MLLSDWLTWVVGSGLSHRVPNRITRNSHRPPTHPNSPGSSKDSFGKRKYNDINPFWLSFSSAYSIRAIPGGSWGRAHSDWASEQAQRASWGGKRPREQLPRSLGSPELWGVVGVPSLQGAHRPSPCFRETLGRNFRGKGHCRSVPVRVQESQSVLCSLPSPAGVAGPPATDVNRT